MHTIVSDGEMTPEDIINCAKEIGLEEISITDHDAVGAYKNFGCDPVLSAAQAGILLIPGVEMDSFFQNVEIHVLGYGIDIHNKELNEYLAWVHDLRRKRLREQLVQVNEALGEGFLKEEDIFLPQRDTLMNPHLVHPLLKKGMFSEYREAARWVKKNTHSSVKLPKPSTAEMITLLKNAGGRTFMAHPGYYLTEGGLEINRMLDELKDLDGLEVDFPYFKTSCYFDTREKEQAMYDLLYAAAKKFNLDTSRGSDAHRVEQLRAFNQG